MKVKPLLQSIDTSNFIEQYLTACGVEDVEDYLEASPDSFDNPWDYPNMETGVARLKQAISNNEKIGVLIDVDADGLCSSTLIYRFIKSISPAQPIDYFIHTVKQHGLVESREENIVQQVIGAKIDLMIIPDASSNDAEQCTRLKAKHIDCLILDHHEIDKPNPDAIVINHHLGEGLNTALSGTGVTYKFVQAYCERYGHDIGKQYLDLVATSIVTDVCDMTQPENFAYVKAGFANMTNPMLKAMYEAFNTRGNNPVGVAWGTGPKINAAFRGDDMEIKHIMFKAMVGLHDVDNAISTLKSNHETQARITQKLVKEITPSLDLTHKVVIGYTEPEFKAFSGLIAGKLSGEYNKPSLVLREQRYGRRKPMLTGSMRSPVELAQQINESGLATCQGHKGACGIWFPKANLEKLIKWFDNQDLASESVKPVTAQLEPNQINLALCHACCDDMLLWGGSEQSHVPQPKFYLTLETMPNDVTVYVKRNKTVKLNFGKASVLKFNAKGADIDLLMSGKCQVEALVTLDVNEWNGVESPQCKIEEWEIRKVEEKDASETSWEDLF